MSPGRGHRQSVCQRARAPPCSQHACAQLSKVCTLALPPAPAHATIAVEWLHSSPPSPRPQPPRIGPPQPGSTQRPAPLHLTCAADLPHSPATCTTVGCCSSSPHPKLAYATTATPLSRQYSRSCLQTSRAPHRAWDNSGIDGACHSMPMHSSGAAPRHQHQPIELVYAQGGLSVSLRHRIPTQQSRLPLECTVCAFLHAHLHCRSGCTST